VRIVHPTVGKKQYQIVVRYKNPTKEAAAACAENRGSPTMTRTDLLDQMSEMAMFQQKGVDSNGHRARRPVNEVAVGCSLNSIGAFRWPSASTCTLVGSTTDPMLRSLARRVPLAESEPKKATAVCPWTTGRWRNCCKIAITLTDPDLGFDPILNECNCVRIDSSHGPFIFHCERSSSDSPLGRRLRWNIPRCFVIDPFEGGWIIEDEQGQTIGGGLKR
jgi:hypothetical protein